MNFKKYICLALAATFTLGCISAQTSTKKSSHSAAHRQLLANQTKSKDQIRLVDKNSFIDLIDDIEPEPDIYTEGWNSRSVNPFREADVPFSHVINVTGYAMPVSHSSIRVNSKYGYRAKFGRMHKGIDLHIRNNDTIYAAYDGKVRLTNYEARGYGNYVILRHPNDLETVYGHLNRILVKPNQTVKAGQAIALGGSTGRSTGPHLHFETRYMGYAINPQAIFDFASKTVHTDTYKFTKSTYTQPRNFAPRRDMTAKSEVNPYQNAESVASSYTVKSGDTVASIARSYGMSATTLRRINGMKMTDKIHVGQVLNLK